MSTLNTQELITALAQDIDLIETQPAEKHTILYLALVGAYYKALKECEVTSRITKKSDEFYAVNIIYWTSLNIALQILNESKKEHLDFKTKFDGWDEKEKQLFVETNAIFIALLAKLFRGGRSVKTVEEFKQLLPVYIWTVHVLPELEAASEKVQK